MATGHRPARPKKVGCARTHLVRVLKVQPQRDRTVFSIVSPSHAHVLLLLLGDLRAERQHVRDKGSLVVADHLDVKIARVLLHTAKCAGAIDVWQIKTRCRMSPSCQAMA